MAASNTLVGSTSAQVSAEERQARIDLAALYRIIEYQGWGEGIFNHCSMRVPGEPSKFLIKPHALTYEEVTASNLVKLDMHEDLDEASGVNRAGFVLHSTILKARPDVNCALHLHTPAGIAMSSHGKGLRMICQQALRFYNRIGYHNYEGLTVESSEGERIARDLGKNRALVLRNHGLVTVGKSPRECAILIEELLLSCEAQLLLEASGAPIIEVPPELCEHVARQFEHHDGGRGAADWPAWVRRMDRLDPSFRS